MQVEITIGWTISDMHRYSSFDGYVPGERQHTETVTVDFEFGDALDWDVLKIAEACFEATNAPTTPEDSLAGQISLAIQHTGYRGRQAHYSLSVGDTVTVGEVTLACEGYGWKRVASTLGARP